MPNLQSFRDYHYRATAQVSDNTRTLALAAVAIVWIFKLEIHHQYFVPNGLKCPLFLVVVALGLDFLQYVYSSAAWHIIFRRQEELLEQNKITEDSNLYVDSWVNNVAYVFFYVKVLFLVAAYIELGAALLNMVK